MLSWCLVTERWSEPALKAYFSKLVDRIGFRSCSNVQVRALLRLLLYFLFRFLCCLPACFSSAIVCLTSCFSRASLPSSFKPKLCWNGSTMMLQCDFSFLCLKHTTAILLGLCSADKVQRCELAKSLVPCQIQLGSVGRVMLAWEGCELLRRDQTGRELEQISIRK